MHEGGVGACLRKAEDDLDMSADLDARRVHEPSEVAEPAADRRQVAR